MTTSVNTSTRPRPSRPLPARTAPAAAPPVEATSAPWAALLAEPLETGAFEWVMSVDGALVPVALGSGERSATPRRSRFVGRLIGR
jgi:hypothetical protein